MTDAEVAPVLPEAGDLAVHAHDSFSSGGRGPSRALSGRPHEQRQRVASAFFQVEHAIDDAPHLARRVAHQKPGDLVRLSEKCLVHLALRDLLSEPSVITYGRF